MAALDSASLDTDEGLRIEPRSDPMKLTVQIAAGIFLAGIISWIFWLSIFAAAAPKIAEEATRLLPPIRFEAPGRVVPTDAGEVIPRKPTCENFVQMTNGARHCLENQHPRWAIESATLPPPPPHSTAR
jgi:hypothetical protein